MIDDVFNLMMRKKNISILDDFISLGFMITYNYFFISDETFFYPIVIAIGAAFLWFVNIAFGLLDYAVSKKVYIAKECFYVVLVLAMIIYSFFIM